MTTPHAVTENAPPKVQGETKDEDENPSASESASEGSLDDPLFKLSPEEQNDATKQDAKSPAIDFSATPPETSEDDYEAHGSSSMLEVHPDSLLDGGETTSDDEPEFLRLIESGENILEQEGDNHLDFKSAKKKKKKHKKKSKTEVVVQENNNNDIESDSSESFIEISVQRKSAEIDSDRDGDVVPLERGKTEDSPIITGNQAERPKVDLREVTSTKARTITIDPMANHSHQSPVHFAATAAEGKAVGILEDKAIPTKSTPVPSHITGPTKQDEAPISPSKSKKKKKIGDVEHTSPSKKKAKSKKSKKKSSTPFVEEKFNDLDEDHRSMAEELHKLLDKDLFDEKIDLDVKGIQDLLEVSPEVFALKYIFDVFGGAQQPVYPLWMLCALGAPLEVIQKCFDAHVDALLEKDDFVGGPLHYACAYRGTVEIAEFLVGLDDSILSQTNQYRRTPLHMAAMFGATSSMISYLIKMKPSSPQETDSEGMTALHLACENYMDDPTVIEKLIEGFPLAIVARTNTGATPLHLALAQGHPISVAKALVKGHDVCLQVIDDDGNIPLHVAVLANCDTKTIKFLVKCFPGSVTKTNKNGNTAWDIGREIGLDEHDLKLIAP